MPTPDRTSLDEIIAAGREILEAAGPSGLTMQAVALRVGVRAPSLYKRVRDRDALIAAVAESVIDDLADELERVEQDGIEHDRTDELLAGLATAYRAFARAHPEGFRVMFTASAPLASLDRAAGPVLRASAALAGEEHALEAARLLTAWMTGFLQMELAGAFRLGGDVDQAFEYGLTRLVRSLEVDVLPH
ncbi:TetR/AcrR family transcriptional regulator [Microbacterium sp. AK031]|uniref:TetR/AcrR family transcriptional regulator n=1 Tax=Microbacterium sp. AK031 TaxID=2723076 RepID=UPI002168031F|nr:TetR/AcrR family transcriptional regulator [Microbacterium sp. AK031]MCS3842963.1 AcrR family transcriptional regulator [Microbacterium sp. AK031]